MLESLCPESTDRGADYRFYNTFNDCVVNADEAVLLFGGIDHHIPHGHQTGWNFSDVSNEFVASNHGLIQIRVTLSGWGDDDDNEYEDFVLGEI